MSALAPTAPQRVRTAVGTLGGPGVLRRPGVLGRAGALARSHGARQVLSFGAIGIASTLAYVVAYAGLRSVLNAALANGLALVVTAIGNTAANRRLTFNVRGSDRLARDHLAGLAAFGSALALTSGAIWLLGLVAPDASRAAELATLVSANTAATVVRFLLLRRSIAGIRHATSDVTNGGPAAPAAAAAADESTRTRASRHPEAGMRGSPTEPLGEA